MALAQSYGLPGALDQAGGALGLETVKSNEGARLIRKFSIPDKEWGLFVEPDHAPEDFERFGEYCAQDVRAEMAIHAALPHELGPYERKNWLHQMRQNLRGFPVDVERAAGIARAAQAWREKLSARAKKLTGGIAPTQRNAVLEWLREQDEDLDDLKKKTVAEAIKTIDNDVVREVLELRSGISKTSVKKYDVLVRRAGSDRRLRHWGVYHGAGTGRVTHKDFQPGNLPRGEIKGAHVWADLPVELLSDPEAMGLIAEPMTVYSAMVRSMIAAEPGKALFAGDYAQIEARMLAYLAGQTDLLEVFANDEDVYRYTGSRVYHLPPEDLTDEQRFIGKSLTLGCGYGMGPNRFCDFCNDNGGSVTPEQAEDAIAAYREANHRIVQFWYEVKRAALNAVKHAGSVYRVGKVAYKCSPDRKWLACMLPSGRCIWYLRPSIEIDVYGEQLNYWGVNPYSRQWSRLKLWHGVLVENIVQGGCADLMRENAQHVEAGGYPVVLTVHDEIVSQAAENLPLDVFRNLMAQCPSWCSGLPIKVTAWKGARYRK